MFRNILLLFIVSLLLCHPLQAHRSNAAKASQKIKPATTELCRLAAARMEEKYQIRENLLQTITSVETGRWDKENKTIVAWPWTVNANGKGTHYETKEEALKAIRKLQKEGVDNIDVGCMQISLKYHKDAFENLEAALDPETNVEYSAKFLKKLYQKKKSWQKAAMAYHSGIPSRGEKYKNRLESRFEKIKLAYAGKDASLF